ncbi:MAG TPA: hypothetical protein GXZ90_00465 [Clostridiales bacterium]|nr:hypothetical protein [Clostridiales bacterium]
MTIHYLISSDIKKNKLQVVTIGDVRNVAHKMIADYKHRLKSYDKDTLGNTLLKGDINKINNWLKEIETISNDSIVSLMSSIK